MAGTIDAATQASVDKLSQAVKQYVEVFGLNVDKTAIEIALQLEGNIKESTPVDTGRARASWHTVLPGTKDAYTYSDKHGQSFNGSLSEVAPPHVALVGSNVTYMRSLENGSSKQAPAGMVRINALKMRAALLQAIKAKVPVNLGAIGTAHLATREPGVHQ